MRSTLTLIFLILSFSTGIAQQPFEKFSYRIQLNIIGDQMTEDRIYAIFARELRKSEGVEIVTTIPELIISVVSIDLANQGGVKTGYALSMTARTPMNRDMLDGALGENAKTTGMRDYLMQYSIFQDHVLRITSPDGLESAIADLTAGLQRSIIDVERENWENLVKSLKARSKTKSR